MGVFRLLDTLRRAALQQQSLEQRAKAWLESRAQVISSRQALQAQGWWISDKPSAVNPECLEEPLRSEVLRQMNLPSH